MHYTCLYLSGLSLRKASQRLSIPLLKEIMFLFETGFSDTSQGGYSPKREGRKKVSEFIIDETLIKAYKLKHIMSICMVMGCY